MEYWIIINKIILILYIIIQYTSYPKNNEAIMVLGLLIYVSLNTCIYILKEHRHKKIFTALSIALIIVGYVKIDTVFIIFFPMNVYELGNYYTDKSINILLLGFIPAVFMSRSLLPVYLMVLAFSFIIFTMSSIYTNRLLKLEKQGDSMRKAIDRLTRNFNESREYSKQVEYTCRLEERNRLSQTVHDKIGHSMTGALIQMEAAKSLMDTDIEKAKELLCNSINISKQGIEDIRITLKNLKPPKEQIGINRLKLTIDEFIGKSGVKTSLIYKGDMDIITYVQWKIIIENTSEALTNSMKYSKASSILVNVEVFNKFIKVEVKDNGIGFKIIKKGLGIIGMEERTGAVGGKIIVDGSSGFSVTTLLPIK
ncbi:sensor histidine kinase [Clostridium sp. WILCCON 0269]|uniref:histidine kinase n=1 Tax=Candidatus Clostridium eludens TaxID=3381663 RepID=A0ABW8SLG1_9CLOT